MGTNNFLTISSKWEYVLPPSRPTVYELQRIEGTVSLFDKKKPVAVLGSTIEFRTLLNRLGFQDIYIFEKNIDFYKWTCEWCAYGVENERVIEGDWCNTISLFIEKFQFVLSDLTMGNIEYGKRNKFYNDISNSLQYGGLFIDKVLTNEKRLISLSEIGGKYRNLPINLETVNMFNCEALFGSELLEGGIINTTDFYEVLRETYKNDKVLTKFVEKCHLITPEGCVWYYGVAWEKLRNDHFAYYRSSTAIDDIEGSPYYGRTKQFVNIK